MKRQTPERLRDMIDFELDMGTVWNVATREIPKLLPQIRGILDAVENS